MGGLAGLLMIGKVAARRVYERRGTGAAQTWAAQYSELLYDLVTASDDETERVCRDIVGMLHSAWEA